MERFKYTECRSERKRVRFLTYSQVLGTNGAAAAAASSNFMNGGPLEAPQMQADIEQEEDVPQEPDEPQEDAEEQEEEEENDIANEDD